jgi:hypothetical protein
MNFRWKQTTIEKLTSQTRQGASTVTIAADLGCTAHTVRRMQLKLKLRQPHIWSDWSDDDLDFLRAHYPDTPTRKLAEVMNRKERSVYEKANHLGLRKSHEYLSSPAACRLGHGQGGATRFMPGHVPANKGLKRPGWAPGRMRETQFKKGERSGKAAKNWRPVGTILTDADGYLRIKVREGRCGEAAGFGNVRIWPLMQRHVWEQAYGPIPASHAVVFRDRNKTHVTLDNLELVTRAELMKRNSIHRYPKELSNTIMLLGAIKRKLREHDEKHHDGPAQPSF